MKKYIGLAQICERYAGGISVDYKSRVFYDNEDALAQKWLNLYPNSKTTLKEVNSTLLPYNVTLENMFGMYRDYTALTEAEEIENEKVRKRYELMTKDYDLYKQVENKTITLEEAYAQFVQGGRVRKRTCFDEEL